ncbi:hypothetical protein KC19_4G197700 [Ceratodon purpureus]|uniref:Uncharacterized protein n=1 Tax=Ceratodon purpureus TaxID=3225 RepID=A0A8T0ICQ2_CERPU|nr:hypothetical protein KC19_4G197700 [Ceratodon purpureus]
MADSLRGHRSTWSSISDQVDLRRPAMETFGSMNPSNRPATNRTGSLDHINEKNLLTPPSKSRRTLRQSKSMIGERKAYPLPDPSQFENLINAAPLPSDPVNDILYPMQSLKKEREKSQEVDQVCSPSAQPPMEALKQPSPPASSMGDTDKQPFPGDCKAGVEKAKILGSSVCDSAGIEPLRTVKEEDHVEVKKEEEVQPTTSMVKASSKVVVVCDGEKKFTTAPVDIALNGYATAEGDAIVVVAFLEHIMSPMGMKMVADLKQFSGVNQSILKQTILAKKMEIEAKLRDTSRLQVCQVKKIQLDVKVLPGSNPKALVAKEVIDSEAKYVIFDKNAMSNRKYYEENLSCQILRLRSDGRRVETISLFGQCIEKTGSITSHCSDSSSDSSMNSELSNAPSIWSKLKMFGSKRSTGSVRYSHGGQGSIMGSSRTSSNLGSPRPMVQEEDGPVPEVLEESFSFDSPKPNPAEAYAYAAAGLSKFGTYTRRDGESLKQPTALAA